MTLSKSLPAQLPKLRFLDRFMAGHSGYIAGGCFKNLFLKQTIKDVDIFFHSEGEADLAASWFSVHDDFKPIYANERVKAFRCQKTGVAVEIIFSFFGEPELMIGNFDFTITKAFYSKNQETGEYEFFCHEKFFEHLMNGKLVIDDKILFPLSTFNRSFRYMKYGFGLCGESKGKVVKSLQGVSADNQNDFYFGID